METLSREKVKELAREFFKTFNSYKDSVKIEVKTKKPYFKEGDSIDIICDIYREGDIFDFFIKRTKRSKKLILKRK